MSLLNVLCILVLQIMWMCHQAVRKYLPEGRNTQDETITTPRHSSQNRKRRRVTRFYAKEIEGSVVMAPVEEDMLRYACVKHVAPGNSKTCQKVHSYSVLPTEYVSRDVFTSAWLDSFSVTT